MDVYDDQTEAGVVRAGAPTRTTDGFQKKKFGWGVGGVISIQVFFGCLNFLTLQSPLCR